MANNTKSVGVAFEDPYLNGALLVNSTFSDSALSGATTVDIENTSNSTNGSTSVEPFVSVSTMTGAGGVGGRARFELDVEASLGGWSNALKAISVYGASGKTTGLGSAFVAELTLSAGTTTGTYAPLELELNLGSGAKTGTATSLIYASVNGADKATFDTNGFFFNLAGVTAGAGKVWVTGTTLGTAAGGLRVNIAGTNYWLPVYAAQPTA
jgi:hypothetical protein